jgi:hypothetical protein
MLWLVNIKSFIMKKSIAIFFSLLIVISVTFIIFSCKKSNTSDYRELLGSWISTDLSDTLEFTSDHDFYKMFSGVKDHFDYNLSNDSITIGYNGMLFILVKPSNHSYSLNGDKMTIDFKPQCYGFRPQEINFIRK